MKKRTVGLWCAAITAAALLFGGCDTPSGNSGVSGGTETGTGTVRVYAQSITTENTARSAAGETAAAGDLDYRLEFSSGDDRREGVLKKDKSYTDVELPVGSWRLVARAFEDVDGTGGELFKVPFPRPVVIRNGEVVDIATGKVISVGTSAEDEFPAVPPEDAVLIESAADFAKIGVDDAYPLDGYYWLAADITLDNWYPAAPTRDAPFKGTFNGNGKTITLGNPSQEATGLLSIGLFAWVESAKIVNLNVIAEDIQFAQTPLPAQTQTAFNGQRRFGLVAGDAWKSEFRKVSVRGNISVINESGGGANDHKHGHYGVFTGWAEDTTFQSVIFAGASSTFSAAGGSLSDVSYRLNVGGITGAAYFDTKIIDARVEGSVSLDANNIASVGGVYGAAYNTVHNYQYHTTDFPPSIPAIDLAREYFTYPSIQDTHVSGSIYGAGTAVFAGGIGGAGGGHKLVIARSSTSGDVTVNSYHRSALGGNAAAGGILGYAESPGAVGNGTIEECYSTGKIRGYSANNAIYVGGIAGIFRADARVDAKTIEDCYYTGPGVSAAGTYGVAGGIAGWFAGDHTGRAIQNTYALGTVLAEGDIPYLNNPVDPNFVRGFYIYAGGIIGKDFGQTIMGQNIGETVTLPSTIVKNAALNTEVLAKGTHANTFFANRVVSVSNDSSGTTGNAAFSKMAVIEWRAGFAPQTVQEGAGNPLSGADAARKPAQSFYETTLGWDFSSTWTMGPAGYPVFLWQ